MPVSLSVFSSSDSHAEFLVSVILCKHSFSSLCPQSHCGDLKKTSSSNLPLSSSLSLLPSLHLNRDRPSATFYASHFISPWRQASMALPLRKSWTIFYRKKGSRANTISFSLVRPSHPFSHTRRRFLINLPPEEREDTIRLAFAVEQMWWHYSDLNRKKVPLALSLSLFPPSFDSSLSLAAALGIRWIYSEESHVTCDRFCAFFKTGREPPEAEL